MKVLEAAVDSTYKITCDYCKSILKIKQNDIVYGPLRLSMVECPVCGEKIYTNIAKLDGDFSAETLRFPDDFFDFHDGKDINSYQIKKWILEGINYLRDNPSEFSFSTGSGNTIVFIENYPSDKEYRVVVNKGYYETYIKYDNIDFNVQGDD